MSENRRRHALFTTSLLVLTVLVTGCTTGGGGDGAQTDKIRAWWSTDPTTFSPANTVAIDDYRAVRLGFDTLIRRDIDGELIGGLAEDWEQNGAEVTLRIATDRTCADGTPITASVVADSLAYFAAPSTRSEHAAAVFGEGEPTFEADDDSGIVTIALTQPYSDVLSGLTIPQAAIVCPAGLDDIDGLESGTVEGAFSGPYVLRDAKPGVSYDYELREDYDGWPTYSDPLEGTPANHLLFSIGAPSAVANQLLTGELDVAPIEPSDFARFEDDDSFDFIDVITGEHFIMFNQGETSPFRDPKLRRAVAQVIDRAALRDAINPYTAELITTLGTDSMACANTDESLLVSLDPDVAAEVLDGVKIRVIGSNTVGQNGASTVYVQEQLRAAGADVELTNLDVGTWITRVYDEPESWDVTVMGTVNNISSISWGLGMVIGTPISEGGRNASFSENAAATAAFDAALASDTPEEACERFEDTQRAALDAVDFIPISSISRPLIAREGFAVTSPGGREDLTTLRIVG